MKPHIQIKRTQALTRMEILAIIAIVAILALLFLPRVATKRKPPHRYTRSPQIECVNNLKQVGLALRIWEGDNNGKYPMSVSVTNGGGMELIADGNVAGCFQVVSNELSTPRILICPADKDRVSAANFQKDFNNSHISYFINPDADESHPQQIMSGDDNLAVNDVPVKSGLVAIPFEEISWTPDRHGSAGNVLYADGSVSEISSAGLKSAAKLSVEGTSVADNRFAVP
ncbi:MAG TPA: hypothetical protein VMH87_01145 [Pseudomonadales bacterium]|nr:hypothetical protein [Pseudomonadales bacterium]